MKKQVLSIALFILLMATACNNNPNSIKTEEIKTQSSSAVETIHHHDSNAIELNNGAKWKVVPEMMQHIRNMEKDINHFPETNHEDLNEYILLGKATQKNIDQLTSNCTMEGKAHDELHKWLAPYIGKVDELNKSTNITESRKIFNELKASFETFNIFFE